MNNYQNMKDALLSLPNNVTIYVAGHKNTDYDSICSSLAMTRYLNKIGKQALMLLNCKDMPKLYWYEDYNYIVDKINDKNMPYNFLLMDSNQKSRLEPDFIQYFDNALTKLNIDHHEDNKKECKYILSISEMSSACEIVFNLLSLFDTPIDFSIAELLFGGIVSDTNSFLVRTSPKTMLVASQLLEYGIDNDKIIKAVYAGKNNDEISVLKEMLNNLVFDGIHYIAMDVDNSIGGVYKPSQLTSDY